MSTFDEQVGMVMSWAARLIAGTTARWVDCEPSTRQRVYFANHASHFDILIIWSALPREVRRVTRAVAARDYWEKTALRRYLAHRVFHGIPIEREGHGGGFRGPVEAVRATLDGIGNDRSVIIFPEGTRGEGEHVATFRGGIYHIAKGRPGVELVPVYMENLNRILPKGEFIPVPLLSSISFGHPLVLQAGEKKPDFLERAHRALCALGEG